MSQSLSPAHPTAEIPITQHQPPNIFLSHSQQSFIMFEKPASLIKSLEATKVDYVKLGKSGLRVSSPILGGMSLGSSEWGPWVLDEPESLEILKAAWDRGVTTWDTADMYSNGVSEQVIGKAIQKFSIPREKLVIMTKCFVPVMEEKAPNGFFHYAELTNSRDYVNTGGESNSERSVVGFLSQD
jgi:hypothetical protein